MESLKCEICRNPLDEYAKSNDSAYCTDCTNPEGKMFEIFNYFLIPIQKSPLAVNVVETDPESADHGNVVSKTVEWPAPKDPAVYHARASKLFPDWPKIVNEWLKISKSRYFDREQFDLLIEFLMEGRTAEELMIMPRDEAMKILVSEGGRSIVADLMAGKIVPWEVEAENSQPGDVFEILYEDSHRESQS